MVELAGNRTRDSLPAKQCGGRPAKPEIVQQSPVRQVDILTFPLVSRVSSVQIVVSDQRDQGRRGMRVWLADRVCRLRFRLSDGRSEIRHRYEIHIARCVGV